MKYSHFKNKLPVKKGYISMDKALSHIMATTYGEEVFDKEYMAKHPFYCRKRKNHKKEENHISYAITKYSRKVHTEDRSTVGGEKSVIRRNRKRLRVPYEKETAFKEAHSIYWHALRTAKDLIIDKKVDFCVVTDQGNEIESKDIPIARFIKKFRPIFATGYVSICDEKNIWGHILLEESAILKACAKIKASQEHQGKRNSATKDDVEKVLIILAHLSQEALKENFVQKDSESCSTTIKITNDELYHSYLKPAMQQQYGLNMTEEFFQQNIKKDCSAKLESLHFIPLKGKQQELRSQQALQFIDRALRTINLEK